MHIKTIIISRFILLIILILFIFILFQIYRFSDKKLKKYPLSKYLKNLCTGDLLLVSYHSVHGKIVKVFTSSQWTHVGIILKIEKSYDCVFDEGYYVAEVARYNRNTKGVIIKPLLEWLNWNDGRKIGLRKLCQIYDAEIGKERNKKLFDIIMSTKNLEENMNILSWSQALIKKKYKESTYKSFFCSQYVSYCLQQAGIIKKKWNPENYQPWEFLYGNIHTLYPYYYNKGVVIYNDIS
jgi:preprotein translocase subunit YajC